MDEKEFNKIYERDLEKFKKDPMFNLEKDSVKKVFGDKFLELRAIINKHDPIGLIAIPAPEDEYDSEVKTIIVQLDSNMTKDQIHDLVYNEFFRWLDDSAGKKEQYADLAQDIYNWWTKK